MGAFIATPNGYAQAPFSLDTTFRATFDTWYVASILHLPDGKVLVAGQLHYPGAQIPTQHAGLARLNADGSWDSDFPWSSLGRGKMVPWEDRFYIASTTIVRRVLYSGESDATFTMANASPYFTSLQGGDYHVFPDGRVLMTGYHTLNDTVRGFVGFHNFIWFTDQGYLDTTRVHRTGNGLLSTLEQLPDGKFLASGTCTVYDERPTSWIQRMHPDGSLDTTFFTGANWGKAATFLPLPDGRVYAGGLFRIQNSADTLRLVRFLPDGALDPSFSVPHFSLGEIADPGGFGGGVNHVYPLEDGYLIVSGAFQYVNGEPRRGICVLDSLGQVQPLFVDCGVGTYEYESLGITYGSVRGIMPSDDGSGWYIWGAYHSYDDGVVNDTAQRFVSRLHGGDIGLGIPQAQGQQPVLNLYPNPADQWVVLDYDLGNGSENGALVVRDISSRELWRATIAAQRGQQVWDSRKVPAGTYSVSLLIGGHAAKTEVVIIVR